MQDRIDRLAENLACNGCQWRIEIGSRQFQHILDEIWQSVRRPAKRSMRSWIFRDGLGSRASPVPTPLRTPREIQQGPSANRTLAGNMRTSPAMPRDKAQGLQPRGRKYRCAGEGADCLVVVIKRCPGAQWPGSSPLDRVNRQREDGSLRPGARAGSIERFHPGSERGSRSPSLHAENALSWR
jgi:hypothetical protein